MKGYELDCPIEPQKPKTLVMADALFEPGYGFKHEIALLIDDGKIVAIGSARKLADLNPGLNVVDLSGHVILPKFCDHHLHVFSEDRERLLEAQAELKACGIGKICLAGSKNILPAFQTTSHLDKPHDASQYQRYQQNSRPDSQFTEESAEESATANLVSAQQDDKQGSWIADRATDTVRRDSGFPVKIAGAIPSDQNKQWNSQISIETAGQALYKKGCYGSFLGVPIESISDAKAAIDKMLVLGADFIKIIASGIFDPHNDTITGGGFDKKELNAIIEYAKTGGLPVHCHANGDEIIRNCVEAGADVIVHGFLASKETLLLIEKNGVALIPTIAALNLLKHAYPDDASRLAIDGVVTEHMTMVKKASEIGVRILAGSDAGASFIPYGDAFLDELRMLQLAGLPVETILDGSVCGPLAPGYRAEFVILKRTALKNAKEHAIDYVKGDDAGSKHIGSDCNADLKTNLGSVGLGGCADLNPISLDLGLDFRSVIKLYPSI